MEMQDIENQLVAVISGFAGQLPGEQITEMQELARAGEPGIALENLCTQLYEYDVVVSRDRLNQLSLLGKAMGTKPTYWEQLEALG